MQTYALGELYNPDARRPWPAEAAQWRLCEDGVELVIFYANPTAAEVRAVKSGVAGFALLASDAALILAHRFHPLPWSDTPWQACRQTDLTAGLIDVEPGEHLVVRVILVDSTTGLIRAIRMTSWPEEFASAVRAAIGRQLRSRATDAQGGAQIAAWYQAYPTTTALVDAATGRC